MILSSHCRPWQRDAAAQPAQETPLLHHAVGHDRALPLGVILKAPRADWSGKVGRRWRGRTWTQCLAPSTPPARAARKEAFPRKQRTVRRKAFVELAAGDARLRQTPRSVVRTTGNFAKAIFSGVLD